MSSVTFSTTVGGDGSTVTDDDNATTGLGNGGALIRLVPMMQQVVNVASYVVSVGGAASSDAIAASASADAAATSATAAAASYDSFDDRYLGAKTSDPSVDNDGNTLLTGALYWNTTSSVMKIWTGSAWFNPNIAAGYLALSGGTMTGAITFAAGQFGTNVNTFLTTPSSANLAAALTDETGTGVNVFNNTPTLIAPILGTPTSGTLSSCTVDGTNAVGYKNIPQSASDKVTAYTLASTDVGKYIGVGTSGSIVVPNSTYSDSVAIANGDAISIFNNTSGNITLTMTITTAYIGGTDTDKATITLATRGIATILFVSSTVCVVTGNVS
jgi:hypothetical protein